MTTFAAALAIVRRAYDDARHGRHGSEEHAKGQDTPDPRTPWERAAATLGTRDRVRFG